MKNSTGQAGVFFSDVAKKASVLNMVGKVVKHTCAPRALRYSLLFNSRGMCVKQRIHAV
jgi:hypothetical protein